MCIKFVQIYLGKYKFFFFYSISKSILKKCHKSIFIIKTILFYFIEWYRQRLREFSFNASSGQIDCYLFAISKRTIAFIYILYDAK